MANPPLTRSKTRRFYARYVGCGRESGCWSRGETRSSGDGGRDAIALDPLQVAGVRRRQLPRRRLLALPGDRLLAEVSRTGARDQAARCGHGRRRPRGERRVDVERTRRCRRSERNDSLSRQKRKALFRTRTGDPLSMKKGRASTWRCSFIAQSWRTLLVWWPVSVAHLSIASSIGRTRPMGVRSGGAISLRAVRRPGGRWRLWERRVRRG